MNDFSDKLTTTFANEPYRKVDYLKVCDDGIHRVFEENNISYMSEMFLPKEIFIEAFEKYIVKDPINILKGEL